MLNTNSGIDPSSARAFGTTFPAGQNQGGANAFGLGGTPSRLLQIFAMHMCQQCNKVIAVQATYQDYRTITCKPAYRIGMLHTVSIALMLPTEFDLLSTNLHLVIVMHEYDCYSHVQRGVWVTFLSGAATRGTAE